MWARQCRIRVRASLGAATMKRSSTFSMEMCSNEESRSEQVILTSLLHRLGMDKEVRIRCLLTMASLEMTLAPQRLTTPKQELTNLWQVNTRRPAIKGLQPMASMPRPISPKVA